MTSSNRIIRGGDFTGELVSWNAPAVDEQAAPEPPAEEPTQQADPAQIIEQARQQGFEQGRQEGIAAGRAELQQQAELLQRVLAGVAQPLQQIDRDVEDELLTLITVIARQLVRRELHQDPSHIIGIIREGLAALPAGAAQIRVRLHPADADVVRELLQPDEAGRAWEIEADPLMEQGGCRIVSETAQIDGRLDTRLTRLIAGMLEDERAGDE